MSKSILARVLTTAACGTLLLPVACSSKIDECNQVIEVVNQTVTEMGALESSLSSEDPAVLSAAVDKGVKAADATVAKLTALQFKTPEVQKFSADYQKMVKDLAAVYVEVKGETVSANAVVQSLEATNKKIEESVAKVTSTCSSDATAAEECGKISGVLQTLPDDPAADIAGVTAKVAELRALVLANATLKPAVADVASAFEAVAKAATELKAVETKLTASQAKAGELSATESKLVDGFNAFCQAP